MTSISVAQHPNIMARHRGNQFTGKENVGRENQAVRKAGEIAQGNAFADFKFTEFKKDEGLKERPGLTDGTNRHVGYVNKIRRDSVSGKPKEVKKVPLVRTHSKVSFKPGGRKPSVSEKKQTRFTVPVPSHVVPDDHELSPMDVDSPMVRIRSVMTRKPHGVLDIDAIKDPLTCSEYAQDVIDYLQMVERRSSFPEKYLQQKGSDVTPHMRTVLMDWLIQVQVHQDLSQHTLHLCVNLIDKFLSIQNVMLDTLQLLGITSLLIAAKYHERFPPEICDLCHLTDGTYEPSQVLKMERYILKKLNFDLNIPGPVIFLERFLLVNQCEKKMLIQSMSMYLLDLTLTEATFVHFYHSLLAASAIYISRELLGCDVLWDQAFAHYTKYSENDLSECVRAMKRTLSKLNKSKFTGAKQKYAHHDFHSISKHRVLIPAELWPEHEHEHEDHEKLKSNETLIM
ncbi:G2/mitotic-specific cyclin-B2-like [Mercenaria mercenaria]|uniref:G2/mitotic-specific cyclin-B2-like n=1 Tax=Mercenaria mercenaria TaxID=6596 RepID=UPI00234F1055|nr:G2/mitotic-specific cyclin-B2-like [Mercenaria mercenaria]